MKIIGKGGRDTGVIRFAWLRLFVIGREMDERALLSLEHDTGNSNMFCAMVQVGGDSLAEVSVTVFHNNFTIVSGAYRWTQF